MNKRLQKEIFLKNEGNACFDRWHNKTKIDSNNVFDSSNDSIIKAITKCIEGKSTKKKNLLEIGCGEAKRLHWLSKNLEFQCYGIEPSEKAITHSNSKNVKIVRGTADSIDFENNKFDFVVFGFCLYLCNRSDLF